MGIKEPKYYVQDPRTGYFNIRKTINGKIEHLGSYKHEEEAKLAVSLFKKTGWHKEDSWAIRAEVRDRIGE